MIALKAKPGPKRRTPLLSQLEKIPVRGTTTLETENERNRALKFARSTERVFVTRWLDGKIRLWRMA